ncbi:MAG: Protease 2 [Sodalis sp.]|uniref:hypothetical protein n=1 Tax=Sodalis sp. (in: enterobacteria) TaxID=1898979 RepID=UPI0038739B7F|nr:MAG: Protease 2 [Sodalis sp.]
MRCWLCDDKCEDPVVLNYLKRENTYGEMVMAWHEAFRDQLFTEMMERIPFSKASERWRLTAINTPPYTMGALKIIPDNCIIAVAEDFIQPPPSMAPCGGQATQDEMIYKEQDDNFSVL